MVSCSTSPPSSGLEAIKREARREQYKACLDVLFDEYSEEIRAGFYDFGGLAQACHEWARRRVR